MDITTNTAPDTSADDGKNTGAVTGADTQAAQSVAPEKLHTQAEVNRIVEARLAEERKRTKSAADEAARIKAGEFEALAAERQAKLEALEAEQAKATARAAALEAALEATLKERIKALPEAMRKLVAGATVEDRIASLALVEEAAKALDVQRSPGTPRGPSGSGSSPGTSAEAIIAAKRRSGNYGEM